MPESFIGLPPPSSVATKLAADTITNSNGDTVQREWNRDPPVNGSSLYFAAVLAGGASHTFDIPVATGYTGTLWRINFGGFSATSWLVKMVSDTGTPTSLETILTNGLSQGNFVPGHRDFTALPSPTGNAKFQLIVTNLDAQNSNQVYATAYLDQNL